MAKVDTGLQGNIESLAHPVYLDVPMLVSFLAALDDGVSFRSEVAERVGESRTSGAEAGARFGLPSLATLLGLSLSASGQYSRDKSSEESAESTFVREHTAASLFNRLRARLDGAALTSLEDTGQLGDLKPSALVEVRGTIEGNPLRQTLDLFVAFAPFFGITVEEDESGKASVLPIAPKAKSSRSNKGSIAAQSEDQAKMDPCHGKYDRVVDAGYT